MFICNHVHDIPRAHALFCRSNVISTSAALPVPKAESFSTFSSADSRRQYTTPWQTWVSARVCVCVCVCVHIYICSQFLSWLLGPKWKNMLLPHQHRERERETDFLNVMETPFKLQGESFLETLQWFKSHFT